MTDIRKLLYDRYRATSIHMTPTIDESRYAGYYEGFYKNILAPILRRIPRDELTLDLGCGAGYLLEALKRDGFRELRGVDASPEQSALAKARGFDVQTGLIQDCLAGCTEVGMVTAIDVLEHFYKHEAIELSTAVWKALRPGGTFVIQTVNGQGFFAPQFIYGDMTHFSIYTHLALAQLLHATGFRYVTFYEIGPYGSGLTGAFRKFAWKMVKRTANFIRFIEGGKAQSLYSANLICTARKPE